MTATDDLDALRNSVASRSQLAIPRGEIMSVTEAAELVGKSGETIRRWCIRYGIGRQYRAYAWAENKWQVSRPGLLMVAAGDWDALADFLAGDRGTGAVQSYLVNNVERR